MGDFAHGSRVLWGAPTIMMVVLSSNPGCAAEVYKTLDAQGHVVYTDHADPKAPSTTVQVTAPSAKQAARIAGLRAAHRAEDLRYRKQQSAEAAKMAQLARDADRQCEAAQKKFYALKREGDASASNSHISPDPHASSNAKASADSRISSDGPGSVSGTAASMKREAARQAMILACTD